MRFATITFGLLAGFLAACSGSDSGGPPTGPHAMGAITVIEAHATTGGNATSTIAAGFIPDAATAAPVCTKTIAGCEVMLAPDCNGTCGAKQFCTFDQGCTATCKPICDATCSDTEECYFPTPTTSACRQRQSFDAGTLTLSGTTTPVTLFPPYSFKGIDSGSLFNDGAELAVTATGAGAGAGYLGFTESFTATHVFRTEPSLDKLGISDIFGAGDVPIRWTAGQDDITVTATVIAVSGKAGTLTCKGDDTTGKFDLPRQAIKAVLATGDTLGSLTVAVTRNKVHSIYDLSTTGTVPDGDVQAVGWLDLATSSTETTSFAGCSNDQQVCDNACVDVSTNAHCGSCGNACASGDSCATDTCSGPAACNACFNTVSTGNGVCASAYAACTNDADCTVLKTCLAACTDATCQQTCVTAHPNSVTLYNMGPNCICSSGCPTECSAACQQ
ncbi:MAG: hypothetical protein ABI591_04835 [Kofleriaceae bacterium]